MREKPKERHAKINFLNPSSPPTEPEGYTGVTFVRDALGNIRAMVPEAGGLHAETHYDGGNDEIDITQLAGYLPPGGADWTLITSWSHSVSGDTTNIDVTGLDVTDILVVVSLVSLSVAGKVHMRVSTDNGSTFYATSGDYVQIAPATGAHANTTVISFTRDSDITTAGSGIMRASLLNHSGVTKVGWASPDTTNALIYFLASTSPVNAIRIFSAQGGNLTSGNIYVFGR